LASNFFFKIVKWCSKMIKFTGCQNVASKNSNNYKRKFVRTWGPVPYYPFTYLKFRLNKTVKFTLYKTVFRGAMLYASPTWTGYAASHKRRLQKQILAQQPGGVRAFPFGISRQISFFSEVGLSDQRIQPSFR
jgi:hypothetical protein